LEVTIIFEHKWLKIGEAADYLGVSIRYFCEELKRGRITYSVFGGQLLFNTNQLDEFLFGLQIHLTEKDLEELMGKKGHSTSSITKTMFIDTIEKDPTSLYETSKDKTDFSIDQNFMETACKLWDDSKEFTAIIRTKGYSCQFGGEPRLWLYPTKLQVPARGKGNKLYDQIRGILPQYFPQITSKATVHIDSPTFSWQKFKHFVHHVKKICNESKVQTKDNLKNNEENQRGDVLNMYDKCINLWEELPEFTIVYGKRGCSARHNKGSRLWFFEDYIKIPTEEQNNNLFETIKTIKEECFRNVTTKTKIPLSGFDIDWEQVSTFINKVKSVCKEK